MEFMKLELPPVFLLMSLYKCCHWIYCDFYSFMRKLIINIFFSFADYAGTLCSAAEWVSYRNLDKGLHCECIGVVTRIV